MKHRLEDIGRLYEILIRVLQMRILDSTEESLRDLSFDILLEQIEDLKEEIQIACLIASGEDYDSD